MNVKSHMKKVLMVVGGITLLAGAYAGALLGYGYLAAGSFDKESKAYVDRVIPDVFASFSQDKLLPELDVVAQKVTGPEDLKKIMNMSRDTFGGLKEYVGSNGQARIKISLTGARAITAGYRCKLKFEKAEAIVYVTLVKRSDGWKILGFNINPVQQAK